MHPAIEIAWDAIKEIVYFFIIIPHEKGGFLFQKTEKVINKRKRAEKTH